MNGQRIRCCDRVDPRACLCVRIQLRSIGRDLIGSAAPADRVTVISWFLFVAGPSIASAAGRSLLQAKVLPIVADRIRLFISGSLARRAFPGSASAPDVCRQDAGRYAGSLPADRRGRWANRPGSPGAYGSQLCACGTDLIP